MKQLTTNLKLLFGVALLTSYSLALATGYSFKTIDVPGASQTTAFGINDAGKIVGSFSDVAPQHGFLFKDGNFTTFDYPVGPPLPTDFFTIAHGINDSNQIVGTYNVSPGLPFGFLFDHHVFSTLTSPGVMIAEARGITNTGAICGTFAFPDKPGLHSYLLKQGVFTIIDVPDSITTTVYGINNAEDTVGVYIDANNKSHGYLLKEGNVTVIERPGATMTIPYGINSAGVIVGSFTDDGGTHGFVLKHGKFKTIDFPDAAFTEVFGINSEGHIVGDYKGADGKIHGFVAKSKAWDDAGHDHDGDLMKLPFSHK